MYKNPERLHTKLSGGYLWAVMFGEDCEICFFTFHIFHNQYIFLLYFINFFFSFYYHLLSAYSMPSSMLGAGDISINMT